MEETKINVFAIPVFSFIPTKYKELVKESAGKLFLAVLIVFLIISGFTAISFNNFCNELSGIIKEQCPDFVLSNGEFEIEKPFLLDEDGYYAVIDDSIEDIDEKEVRALVVDEGYNSVMILGHEKMCVYNNGQLQTIKYSDLNVNFSKSSLTDTVIPTIKPIVIAIIFACTILAVGMYYLGTLILSALASIVAKIMKVDIESKDRFRITLLAGLAVHIVTTIIGYTPINLPALTGAVLVLVFDGVIFNFFNNGDSEEYNSYTE